MSERYQVKVIARMHSLFPTKFGIPRQSGLVEQLHSLVVFEPEYRDPQALRGIEEFSHLWLIWQFSQAVREDWSPTVRPPKLGGNRRMGVFATRSPFRPNAIGLSSVRLEGVDLHTNEGPVLHISGADLMDSSPIFDIKPYLPYTDAHPEAVGGFAALAPEGRLRVLCPDELLEKLPPDRRPALLEVLSQDPRPAYQSAPDRIYGMPFANTDVRFRVEGDCLTVLEILPGDSSKGKQKP